MVTLIAGLPASGKSTIARKLFARVLEYDSFADELGSYEELDADRELVNRQFALLAGSGRFDAVVEVFSTRSWRAKVLEACPGAGIITVRAPLDVCLRRNAMRQKTWVSNSDILSIAYRFEPVSPDEGFSFIKYIDTYQELSMDEKIWLRIVKGEVVAYGDEETLKKVAKGRFDKVISLEEWERCGCRAHVGEGDAIVLGEDEAVVRVRNEELVRNARDIKLRKECDKIGASMRWEAMTEGRRDAWRRYRQALLDITDLPGFPWDGDLKKVPWPVKPE